MVQCYSGSVWPVHAMVLSSTPIFLTERENRCRRGVELRYSTRIVSNSGGKIGNGGNLDIEFYLPQCASQPACLLHKE